MRRILIAVMFLMFAAPVRAEVSLQSYCKDGYYQIPGEKKCSRAPKCGGKTYDELNKAELMPNNNDCLDEGRGMVIGDPPNSSAFYGYYPLCCYEMARLKDPEMCIGYWERLWCHPDQCAQIDNAHGCGGGGCNCAHATKGWCETRKCNLLPPVPLEVRLHQVTNTPTAPPQPTATPYIAPTDAPIPTSPPPPTAAPVILPTVSVPTTVPPTSVPFSIGSSAPSQSSAASLPAPTPIAPLNIAVPFKAGVRRAVLLADNGLRPIGETAYAVRKADAVLEYRINSFFTGIISYIRSLISR